MQRHWTGVAGVCGVVTALAWSIVSTAAVAAEAPTPLEAWARAHAVPLRAQTADLRDAEFAALAAVVGDARLVSYGEGLHGGAEPLEFRNRLFRYLVERKGFTGIALESGVAEGIALNRYVHGGPGDIDAVLKAGLTNGFDAVPQNRELVEWMRAWNADPKRPRISFFGMDVSGTQKDMQRALRTALDYLGERDAPAANALRERIADLWPRLVLDRLSTEPHQYTGLTQAERDRVTGTINDLIATLGMRETQYRRPAPDGSHERSYDEAMQLAVAARQTDDYLRRLPIGWSIQQGPKGLEGTVASADRTKADNIAWALEQLGPKGRLLLFAHRDHLVAEPMVIRLAPDTDPWPLPPLVGLYLKPRYGAGLVTIGHFFGGYALECGKPAVEAPAGSFERQLASATGAPQFLLDLRKVPGDVRAWLETRREQFGVPPLNTSRVLPGYEAIHYTRTVGPLKPCG